MDTNKYIARQLQAPIEQRLRPGKAVLVYGPRRVGKTVLMQQIASHFQDTVVMLNGEDLSTQRTLAERSIANYRQLYGGTRLLIIDEAQQVPDIGRVIKLMIDEVPGLTVLASGSSSFDLHNRVGEPLVGRSTEFTLTPLSVQELSAGKPLVTLRQDLYQRLIYGAYPEVVTMDSDQEREQYLRNIVDAYLLKDLLSLNGLRNSGKIFNLLQLVAMQVGSEVSYQNLARQLSMDRETVEKYLDLLSKVFVIYRLGAYANNLRKEVTKAGKWYFYDNGVRNAVLNRFDPASTRSDIGALWENYIVTEMAKSNINNLSGNRQYFWRTYDQQEVDLIEATPHGSLKAYEIKWGDKQPRLPAAFGRAYPQATYQVINPDNFMTVIPSGTPKS